MADEKKFTPQEVAFAVLAKAQELLSKSELIKAETGHEKGINTQSDPSQRSRVMMGTSKAGSQMPLSRNPTTRAEDVHDAKKEHGKVLGEMKGMPKPNLPKSENIAVGVSGMHKVEYHLSKPFEKSEQDYGFEPFQKSEMSKDGLSPAEIRAKMKKSDMAKDGLSPEEIRAKMKKSNPDEKEDAQLGEQVEGLCEKHMLENKGAEKKEGHKIVKSENCVKCMVKSEFADLYADLEAMAKAEGVDENEIGTKFGKSDDEGQGSGIKKKPSNDMKPQIEEKPIERDNKDFETKPGHAPENDHRQASTPSPESNPVEQKEGNNPPAGSTPGAEQASGATAGTGKKGVHKLSFFMGHCHHKKAMKKGIALG